MAHHVHAHRPWRRVAVLVCLALGVAVGWRFTAHHLGRATPRADAAPAVLRAGQAEPAPAAPIARAEGTVRDADARPVAGAWVCAAPLPARPDSALTCTGTDAAGHYALTGLEAASYVISAHFPGLGAAAIGAGEPLRLLRGAQREGLDIVLARTARELSGVVEDALGGPVPGALVHAVSARAHSFQLTARTADDGRFAFWVEEGAFALTASAEGYVPARAFVPAPSRQVELSMLPESKVMGRVVSAHDGRPIADASVALRALSGAGTLDPPRTDREGAFTVKGVAPGAYLISAQSEHAQGRTTRVLEVEPGSTLTGVVVELVPGRAVAGRVRGEDGTPACHGGRVALLGAPDPLLPLAPSTPPEELAPSDVTPQEARVDAEGRVLFGGVPAGRYHVVLRCDGQVRAEGPATVRVGAHDLADLTWTLREGLTLVVRSEDAAGRPVPGTQLVLGLPARGEGRPRGRMPIVTDDQGVARVPSLLAGEYVLYGAGTSSAEPVTIDARTARGEVEARVVLPGRGGIAVRAADERGRPVANLRVRADRVDGEPTARASQSARVVADGSYLLAPLPAGTYRVEASDGVNAPEVVERLEVAAAERTLRFVFARNGALHGRVRDELGAPLANIWVRATAANTVGAEEAVAELTDAEGEFTLSRLSSARGARFRVTASQTFGSAITRDDVGAGDDVTLILPLAVAVMGTVHTADGRPVAGAFVHATQIESGITRSARSEPPDGHYTLSGVMPGEVRMAVVADGFRGTEQTIRVAPGMGAAGVRLALTEDAPALAAH